MPIWNPEQAGGGIESVVEDISPQLGGTLDAQGNSMEELGEVKLGDDESIYGDGTQRIWFYDDHVIRIEADGKAIVETYKSWLADQPLQFIVNYLRDSEVDFAVRSGADGVDGYSVYVDGDTGNLGLGVIDDLDVDTIDSQLQVEGDMTVGDVNNNLSVASDGTITLNGEARVWDGHFLDATNFTLPGVDAATEVTRGAGVAFEFSDGKEDYVYTQYKLPQLWDDIADVKVVLLWDSPTTSADCNWEVTTQIKELDEDMDDFRTGIGGMAITATSSTDSNGLVASQLTIPTEDFTSEDKLIRLAISRDGAADTLDDEAYLHAIWIKGVANKLGGAIS